MIRLIYEISATVGTLMNLMEFIVCPFSSDNLRIVFPIIYVFLKMLCLFRQEVDSTELLLGELRLFENA